MAPFASGTSGNPTGRPRGARNKASRDVKALALRLLEDRAYRTKLLADLRRRKVHPAVEAMLWHYAYGKPADRVQLEGQLQFDPAAARATIRQKLDTLAERLRATGGDPSRITVN